MYQDIYLNSLSTERIKMLVWKNKYLYLIVTVLTVSVLYTYIHILYYKIVMGSSFLLSMGYDDKFAATSTLQSDRYNATMVRLSKD